MTRRFSPEDALVMTGASPEELAHFERRGLLVPNVPLWPPWGKRRPYYTDSQIDVLRWLLSGRRDRHSVEGGLPRASMRDAGAPTAKGGPTGGGAGRA